MKVVAFIALALVVYNLVQVVILTVKKRKLEYEMQDSRKEILEEWKMLKERKV